MRILPNLHFAESYKKHYKENCEKIQTFNENRKEARAEYRENHPFSVKNLFIGVAAFAGVLAAPIIAGVVLKSQFAEKNNIVKELEASISEANVIIQSYQAVDTESMNEQIETAVFYVTSLQNQYLKNEFSDDFDIYADRYLGEYNSDWAEDIGKLVSPVWKGYVDKASSYSDPETYDKEASMVFILYDEDIPIMTVDVIYSLDYNGNLGVMSSIRKLRLT